MSHQYDLLLEDFNKDDRVELSPHLDAWVAGDRFGCVVGKGRVYVHVEMDRSKKIRRISPENLRKL